MGWEDRQYYRDGSGQMRNPLLFLFSGSLPLFTLFGIRVRIHMSLVLLIVVSLLVETFRSHGSGPLAAAEVLLVLFVIILLHEFGHCFASRWVGGEPDQIVMSPLGGAAFVNAPHRPGATFIAVAGGPMVNVLICLVCFAIMAVVRHQGFWNPFHVANEAVALSHGWLTLYSYVLWIYLISLGLLLFNLLPIFPLDGGQLLQSLLWFKVGYYKSMMFACVTGMVGGGVLVLVGVASQTLLLAFIGAFGILTCVLLRRQVREMGPDLAFANDNMMDFSASLRPDAPPRRRRKVSRWTVQRLRRQAQRDASEQQIIDSILAKVSALGMHTLTWAERRALKRATDRQRRRDLELSRND